MATNWAPHAERSQSGVVPIDIASALGESPYPGRGVLIFGSVGGALALVYFLTGRTDASKQRTLVADGGSLTAASTAGQGGDPLRHYRAAVRIGDWDIVGNGEHVDQLATALSRGESWEQALSTVDPEPDPPLFTARIFVAANRSTRQIVIGGARSRYGDQVTERILDFIDNLRAGDGMLITTYRGSPDDPTPAATPVWVGCDVALETMMARAWDALDGRYRVARAGRLLTSDEWDVRSSRTT
jgi:hypothetical protein